MTEGPARWKVVPCEECSKLGLRGRWQIFTPKGFDSGCTEGQNDAMTLARHFAIKFY